MVESWSGLGGKGPEGSPRSKRPCRRRPPDQAAPSPVTSLSFQVSEKKRHLGPLVWPDLIQDLVQPPSGSRKQRHLPGPEPDGAGRTGRSGRSSHRFSPSSQPRLLIASFGPQR